MSDYLKNIAHSIQNKSGDISRLQQEAKTKLAYAKEHNYHASAAFKEHKRNMALKSIGNKYDKIYIKPEDEEELLSANKRYMIGAMHITLEYLKYSYTSAYIHHIPPVNYNVEYSIPIVPIYTEQFPLNKIKVKTGRFINTYYIPNFTEKQKQKVDEDISNFKFGLSTKIDLMDVFLPLPVYFRKVWSPPYSAFPEYWKNPDLPSAPEKGTPYAIPEETIDLETYDSLVVSFWANNPRGILSETLLSEGGEGGICAEVWNVIEGVMIDEVAPHDPYQDRDYVEDAFPYKIDTDAYRTYINRRFAFNSKPHHQGNKHLLCVTSVERGLYYLRLEYLLRYVYRDIVITPNIHLDGCPNSHKILSEEDTVTWFEPKFIAEETVYENYWSNNTAVSGLTVYDSESNKTSNKFLVCIFSRRDKKAVIYEDYHIIGKYVHISKNYFMQSIFGKSIRYYAISLPNSLIEFDTLDLTYLEGFVSDPDSFNFMYVYVTFSVLIGVHTLVLLTEDYKPIGTYHIITEDDFVEFPYPIGDYSLIHEDTTDIKTQAAKMENPYYKKITIAIPTFKAYLGQLLTNKLFDPISFGGEPVVRSDIRLDKRLVKTVIGG